MSSPAAPAVLRRWGAKFENIEDSRKRGRFRLQQPQNHNTKPLHRGAGRGQQQPYTATNAHQPLPASPPVIDDSAGNPPGAKMSSAPAFKWRGEQHCFEYAPHAPPRSMIRCANLRLDRGGGRRRGSAGGRRGVFSNLIPTTPSRTTHPQRLPASPPVNDDSAGNTPGAKMSSAPAFKWRGEQHCFEYACHAPPRSRLAGGELASRSGRWAPARFSRRSEGRLQQANGNDTTPLPEARLGLGVYGPITVQIQQKIIDSANNIK